MGVYAVIQTGGKQHRVSPGDTLKVEKLTAEPGEVVSLQDIRMLIADGKISTDRSALDKAQVKAEVLGHGHGDKVIALKFKRRKHHRKKQGHRQDFTELRITEIAIDANSYKAESQPARAATPKVATKTKPDRPTKPQPAKPSTKPQAVGQQEKVATANPTPKQPKATTQIDSTATTNKAQAISRTTPQPEPATTGPEAPADDDVASIATQAKPEVDIAPTTAVTTPKPIPKTSMPDNSDIAAKAIIADSEANIVQDRVTPSTTNITDNAIKDAAGERSRGSKYESKHGLMAAVLIAAVLLLLLFFYGLYSHYITDNNSLPAIINVETKQPIQETNIKRPAPIIEPSEPDQPPE